MNSREFLEYYSYDDTLIPSRPFHDELIIIVPLVIGVCVSLPALIWAVYVLYTLHKQGSRISAFVILLIINDLVELLLSAVIAAYLINIVSFNATKSEYYVIYFFITFRIVGLYLHQLVALESMLSFQNQQCSAHVFSPLCSTVTCVILWLVVFGCQFLGILLNLIITFFPLFILVFTCLQCCIISVAPDRINPGSAVLIVSTLTLITFCATSGLVHVFTFFSVKFNANFLEFLAYLISLRVTSDPVLCVLVSKQQLRVYEQQPQTELNVYQIPENNRRFSQNINIDVLRSLLLI